MGTTRRQASAPAQSESINNVPFVFEWYENPIQQALQHVYRNDLKHRQKLVEIMEELRDAEMVSKLLSSYTDAKEANPDRELDVLFGMLARIYIAGSRRGYPLFEDGIA